MVADCLFECIREAIGWAESCPCHDHVVEAGLPQTLQGHQKSRDQCPMRGRRAYELATDVFCAQLARSLEIQGYEVLARLSADLDSKQRSALLHDFARGKAHLLWSFTLKLGHWATPPWNIMGSCHPDPAVAREIVRGALEADCAHPAYVSLQSAPLREEAWSFVEGTPLSCLCHLHAFVAQFAFPWTAERQVEGFHEILPNKWVKPSLNNRQPPSNVPTNR